MASRATTDLFSYLSGTSDKHRARAILRRVLPEAEAANLGPLSKHEAAELDDLIDESTAGVGGDYGTTGSWSRKPEPGAFRDDIGRLLRIGAARPARPVGFEPLGRMRVNLVVNGGTQGFMDVMEGLVRRNERSIREGKLPTIAQSGVKHVENPVWRDAIGALVHGSANAGSLAAWQAAERRVQRGDSTARIGLVGGVPMVVSGDSASGGLTTIPVVAAGAAVHGLDGAERDPNHGRIDSWLYVTLDDDKAEAVRDMGDAIARHNAKQIVSEGLPKLYKSGVRYKTEGSPEKWWDAKEILRHGHDDCEGLSAYRAGELMLEGIDAKVWTRLIPKPTSGGVGLPGQRKQGRLFHALVRVDTPNGPEYDDPSMRLGMPIPSWYSDYMAKQRATGRSL